MGSDRLIEQTAERFWSVSRVVAAALTFLWLCFFLSGIDATIAFHDREPGLPLSPHMGLYVVLPTLGLIASSGLFAYTKRLPRWITSFGLASATLLLFYVFVFWTGGI